MAYYDGSTRSDDDRHGLDDAGSGIGWMRDRNGNRISFSYDTSSHQVTQIIDPVGRATTVAYGGACQGGEAPICDHISYPGTNGTTRTIEVGRRAQTSVLRSGYTAQSLTSLFPEIISTYHPANSDLYDADVAAYVKFADGQKIRMYYNSYGEVARVELPTGGAIEYDMGGFAGPQTSGFMGEATGGGAAAISRMMFARREYLSGGVLSSTTTYAYAFGGGNPVGTETTTETVTDAGGAVLRQVTHNYTGGPLDVLLYNGIAYNGWQEGLENSTTVAGLETTEYTWAQAAPAAWCDSAGTPPYTCTPGAGTGEPANNPRRTSVKTTLAGGLTSQATFSYDAYDNVTDKYEYDYGVGSPGPLLRHTATYYVPSGNYAALPVWLIRLPIQQNIYAGADNLAALTYYHYDDYNAHSLTDAPGINLAGRDDAFGAGYTLRGNLTSKDSWINTSNTYASEQYAYNIAGNLTDVWDGLGHPTSYKYDGSYASPIEVKNAAGQITSSSYDPSIGKPVLITDPNGIGTAYEYNDPLDRLTEVRRAANGPGIESQTKIFYQDPNWTTQCSDQNTTGDCAHQTQMVYDGLGRVIQTRTIEDSSVFLGQDTAYDGLGRVSAVTNPYRTNYQAGGNDGLGYATATTYDALGRVVRVQTADGSATVSSYSGNQVTVTDPAGKQRRNTYDALGRLTSVVEDPNGANLLTSYTYDALDNLTTVAQGGQTRTFTYDSLNRLKSATQPESGTTGYEYDNAGNLTARTDNRGVRTSYGYDVLNRLQSKTYSSDPNGTPAVTYTYDDSAVAYGKGRLAKVTNGISTTTMLAYDALGHVLASQQSTGGKTYNLRTT